MVIACLAVKSILYCFTAPLISTVDNAFDIHFIYAYIICFIISKSLLKTQIEQVYVKHSAQLYNVIETMIFKTYMDIRHLLTSYIYSCQALRRQLKMRRN